MTGINATTFAPYNNVPCLQPAVIFYRMVGSPKVEGRNSFTDVEYGPGTTWFYNAVTWAQQNGVMGGYGDGIFGPKNPITREQLASAFYSYAKYRGYDVTTSGMLESFTDNGKVSQWAQEALQWAIGSGIMTGEGGGLLDPQGTVTYAEVAGMLHRFIEKYE